MVSLKVLLDLMESIGDETDLYLLVSLSPIAGFFVAEKRLIYVAKDEFNYPQEDIETDYLFLQTHIYVCSVKNKQSFNDGYYNLIIYKQNVADTNMESFVRLCCIHANNADGISFKDFFYSLIALFQLPTEQSFKNAIGLYGELKFMQFVNEYCMVDISSFWHRGGSYSQFDFSNGVECIEVKSTLSDQTDVSIKHEQIFGMHPCYLAVMDCERYDNGETLEEVISSMYHNPTAFNGINFSINLAKELKRISMQDVKRMHFGVRKIRFYNVEDINPLPIIPDNVSRLTYRMDLSGLEEMDSRTRESILKTFGSSV